MTKMNLEFLPNEANEAEGLNHPGIETYTDEAYASTARECGQNSADAGSDQPVILTFDRVAISRSDLVAHSQLASAIESGLDDSEKEENEKAIDFFENAKKLLDQPEISALRIADFNTHGLRGPCAPGYPFHSLVKASGVSTKESPTAGGSFGIGKYAAFAISDLRTVFYSTLYVDDRGDTRFLMQGKSILMSHADAGGKPRRASGYWGASDYSPIEDEDLSPEWLRREGLGTTIHALGFRDAPNWQYRMAASLIRNFFVSIHRGEMEFSLDDEAIKIDVATLPALFKDEQILAAAKESSQTDDFEYARCLYECLTSEEAKEVRLKIAGLGQVVVRILIREDLPKRLSIIRNGMTITDSLEKFGDKFVSFRMYRDFVAFVEAVDKEGSSLLKRLENPRHDGLSAERISDEQKRAAATLAMKKLAKQIRKAIREETLSVPDEVQALDELAQFFADTDKVDQIPDPESEDDPENYVYDPKVRRRKKPPIPKIRGLDGGGSSGGSGGGGGTGGGSGSGEGGTGGRRRYRPLDLEDTRNVIGDGAEPNHRTVWFTSPESGSITLSLLASGMNESDGIEISQASAGNVAEGRVVVDVVAGERKQIALTIAENYDGPIELVGLVAVEEASNAS